jgi:trimeric autotransporter adhesin
VLEQPRHAERAANLEPFASSKVTAIAYDYNVPNFMGTLYDIDTGIDELDTQEPPESGTLTTVRSLGLNAKSSAGFDIVTTVDTNNQLVNNGYAALQEKGKSFSSFYSIDLATGQATKIGKIGSGTLVLDIAIPIGG